MRVGEQELIDAGVAYAQLLMASGRLQMDSILTSEQSTAYGGMMGSCYLNFGGPDLEHPRAWEHTWGLSVAMACRLGIEEQK